MTDEDRRKELNPASAAINAPEADFATLDEAFAAMEARTNLERGLPPGNPNRVYRLDRMRRLCGAFGDPQDAVPSIHIAGSKGKGSTAAHAAALLASAGLRTGVYASPHLVDYRERFRIQGKTFPEKAALETARDMFARLPELEASLPGDGGATTFELLTLFAFLLFRNCGCDFMVLETGLGGRLDATNVVASPKAVIITPIEKEHTEILGRRIAGIAAEKAGIIKPGAAVWSSAQKSAARRIIRRRAASLGSSLEFMDRKVDGIRALSSGGEQSGTDAPFFPWEIRWSDGRRDTITLAMGGRVQAENASAALAAVRRVLASGGFGETEPDPGALSQVRLPGRFHVLRRTPPVIIDGAHTTRSIAALAESFTAASGPGGNPVLLFGSVLGKDHRGMARILCGGRSPLFREVIISTPGTFKPSNPSEVATSFLRIGARSGVGVRLIPDPSEAWEAALDAAEGHRAILVTGSFFMAGEIAGIAGDSVRQ